MPQVDLPLPMKKLFTIFKIAVLEKLEYRGELISDAFIELYSFILQLFLWRLIIGEHKSVGGYDYAGLVLYYVFTRIFDSLSLGGRKLSKDFMKGILKGDLSNLLLKPFSPKIFYILRGFAFQFVQSILQTMILLGFLFVSGFPIFTKAFTIVDAIMIFFYIIFITIFNMLFYLTISCISFWTESGSGVRSIITLILRILKGNLFPLDIAPSWFINLMKFLPFMYTGFYPTKIILSDENIVGMIRGILILILFSIVLFFVSKSLWAKGMKKYDSVGI